MVTLNAANERIELGAVINSGQIVKVFTIIVLVAITGYGVTVIPFGFAEQLAVLIHIVPTIMLLFDGFVLRAVIVFGGQISGWTVH